MHRLPRPVLSSVLAAALSGSLAAQEMGYQDAPSVLGHDAPRVGEWFPDLEFQGLDGKARTLSDVAGENGLVIALRDVDCPLSKKYSPRTARLLGELRGSGFGLLLLGVQSKEACARDVETHGFEGVYAVDPEGELAARLAAKTTTEVFVLDAARTLAYRGMIDDQHGLGFNRSEPENEFLVEALEAVAAGRRVDVPATQAHGCLLDLEPAPAREGPVTYHERVSRIVQQRCETCHRPGEAAPFTLASYAEVKKRRRMIQFVLEDGIMPPWYAEHGSGPWANDMSVTPEEQADLIAWASGDAAEGDPANAPRPITWVEGWTIGEPDFVIEMPVDFTVPAEGTVDYQYIETQIDLPADRWVEAIEIRPSAPQVVHHVILFVNAPGEQKRFDGGRGFFAATAPGQTGLTFPEGTGKRLPANAEVTFQMHYTANGTEAVDRTRVGLSFADGPLTEVQTTSAINQNFSIPPGAFDYEVQAEYAFPEDASILTLFPHTHLRGVRFHVEVVHLDGRTEDLLDLPNYDFNWQLNYDLLQPLEVPRGTKLRATAWYDNSDGNPANPDASVAVRFGEQTWDEMMINYINWIPSRAVAVEASAPGGGGESTGGESGR